jgi:hypothetical protein
MDRDMVEENIKIVKDYGNKGNGQMVKKLNELNEMI